MNQITWDEYFMSIAKQVARRSKDPSSRNGCVIVDQHHRPVSFGYNGTIQGADERFLPVTERPMKYYLTIHAEMNALLFAGREVKGGTAYITMAPCDNCLKHCLQAGIQRFVYDQLRVNSHKSGVKQSMTSLDTDEAILRLLLSLPSVETLNLTNGRNYVEDILASYPPDSKSHQHLLSLTHLH